MTDFWPKPTFLSLPDQVAKAILSQIVSGRLNPGDKLPSQRELAHSMNVSLSVIREAVQRLEALGIICPRRGSGTVVQSVNWVKVIGDESLLRTAFEEIAGTELWETRHVIEREIVRLAAMRGSTKAFSAIKDVLRAADPVPLNYHDNMILNRDFHTAVAKAAGNPVLEHFVTPLLSLPLKGIAEQFNEDRSMRVWQAHQQIFNAITARDVPAAEAAIDEHLKVGPLRSKPVPQQRTRWAPTLGVDAVPWLNPTRNLDL